MLTSSAHVKIDNRHAAKLKQHRKKVRPRRALYIPDELLNVQLVSKYLQHFMGPDCHAL